MNIRRRNIRISFNPRYKGILYFDNRVLGGACDCKFGKCSSMSIVASIQLFNTPYSHIVQEYPASFIIRDGEFIGAEVEGCVIDNSDLSIARCN